MEDETKEEILEETQVTPEVEPEVTPVTPDSESPEVNEPAV